MNRSAVASVALALAAGAACGGGSATPGGSDASADHAGKPADAAGEAGGLPIPGSCPTGLPPATSLECTGLYADLASKTIAPELSAYTPAVPEWTDGSVMLRWIYLPPGQTIDTTDPSEWTFPVGTRAWMQLSRGGLPVETRYYQKIDAGDWAFGTYAWDPTGSTATLSAGDNITLPGDGGSYHIPSAGECQECHAGRTDSLLGFEAVSLGLRGATGLTLEELARERRLSPAPASTRLAVGDDGTLLAAAPLTWLHVNCGTTCHNTNPNATAVAVGMILRLDPTKLDGQPSTDYPSILTTEGVGTSSPAFPHQTRIVPGSPTHSVLYERIDERNGYQMPPVGSQVVDTTDVAAVAAWIAAMPPEPGFDAGVDASGDARVHDASGHDGAAPDGGRDGGAQDGAPGDAARGDGGAGDSAVPDGGTGDASAG